MHISRPVGKADFATGSPRDTQTYFYILPLIVKFVFAYNIFVFNVIRITVNIGQYHSRRMRDVHGDRHVGMRICMYTYTHARIHTWIFVLFFFSGCGKRLITQIVADPAGIELTKFGQGQHHQLPIVQHVWFTVPKAGATRLKWTCSTSVYAHSVLWHRETLKQTNTLHLRWRIWLLHADFKPDMFSFSFWLWELPEIDPPVVVHHRPANRNAVVTGTRCIVVNQLPRWNWHRCKQSVDCIDLCPFATVHTHAKAWTQACRHI